MPPSDETVRISRKKLDALAAHVAMLGDIWLCEGFDALLTIPFAEAMERHLSALQFAADRMAIAIEVDPDCAEVRQDEIDDLDGPLARTLRRCVTPGVRRVQLTAIRAEDRGLRIVIEDDGAGLLPVGLQGDEIRAEAIPGRGTRYTLAVAAGEALRLAS